ncbi:MAG: TRAP transporter large permease subunit [Burkholderiales bacterium]|nr:TRAP transporter large permease subunit [Burkholderiales bacterium]
MRRELWFGFSLMAIILAATAIFMPWSTMTNGHLGLLMLSLVVVAIMLGFPTAFTLMGMGVMFAWFSYRSVDPSTAGARVLDLMVQRAYAVMSNDVLIAIPLFVFMGYLVERAALIEKLFRSLHLAMARVPGSLAVATIVTCAIFATATGIVGAVVTLMGLLALPAMLKAGYSPKIAAGAITAGGCLGILIPPSVLLIVYGATAGVSVVQLYAGAFFPGLMLAALYVGYVILIAKLKPDLMPPLAMSERQVALPPVAQALRSRGNNAFAGLWRGLAGGAERGAVMKQLLVTLLPALFVALVLALVWRAATAPVAQEATGVVEMGSSGGASESTDSGGLAEPKAEEGGLAEPKEESTGLAEPPKEDETDAKKEGKAEASAAGLAEPGAVAKTPAKAETAAPAGASDKPAEEAGERGETPTWFLGLAAGCALFLLAVYALWTWERLEIFKMLLGSFFPLALLILAVLGSIVFGLSTPTEAAAVGAFGGFLLAIAYRYLEHRRAGAGAGGATVREVGGILKDSSFLTAKTSAMVCWLFVGSSIFSASFALLGGQELVEKWVLSLGLTPLQFMILAQFIIFILGWPLEWTEIIVIFMPIFIPLLPKFGIDPLFFGLLVALNLQTAFLSPPVAMAAFYLKGVAPPHVTLNQIFAGMMPFMGIQVIALVLLYVFPEIGLWLPQTLYNR